MGGGVVPAVHARHGAFHSVLRSAAQVFVSVFVAWLFTDSAVDYMHLDPAIYRVPMGGLIALTADGIVRMALNWAAHPSLPWRNRREGQE